MGSAVDAEDCEGGQILVKSELMKASITEPLSSVHRFIVEGNR